MNHQSCLARQQPATFSGRPNTIHVQSLTRKLHTCRAALFREDDPPPNITSNLEFVYMNPEQIRQAEEASERARQEGLTEYQELKDLLLTRTWRFGTLFAGYLLLTVSGECAFAELLGAAASYGYLKLLMNEVDSIDPDTPNPMMAALYVEQPLNRGVAKVFAAYKVVLKPRLLVPVGLLAGCSAWNAAFPEYSFNLVEEACLIGGFLSFKIALVQKVYDDLKPKTLTEEDLRKEKRPSLVDVGEDVAADIYGRSVDTRKAEEEIAKTIPESMRSKLEDNNNSDDDDDGEKK